MTTDNVSPIYGLYAPDFSAAYPDKEECFHRVTAFENLCSKTGELLGTLRFTPQGRDYTVRINAAALQRQRDTLQIAEMLAANQMGADDEITALVYDSDGNVHEETLPEARDVLRQMLEQRCALLYDRLPGKLAQVLDCEVGQLGYIKLEGYG